jgi:hypothetical protein
MAHADCHISMLQFEVTRAWRWNDGVSGNPILVNRMQIAALSEEALPPERLNGLRIMITRVKPFTGELGQPWENPGHKTILAEQQGKPLHVIADIAKLPIFSQHPRPGNAEHG